MRSCARGCRSRCSCAKDYRQVGSADAQRRGAESSAPRDPARATTLARRPGRARPRRVILLRGGAQTLEVLLVRRTPSGALHGRRVGVPRRRGRRGRGRGRRGPPRGGDPRAARGGGDHARGPRRARQVLALDHARRGADPLRHPLLPRRRCPRDRSRGSTARSAWTSAGSRPPAALAAHAAGELRARVPDDQAPRAAQRVRLGRGELLDHARGARSSRSSRGWCSRARSPASCCPATPATDRRPRRRRRSDLLLLRGDHVGDGVDQREVGERLRVVAEVAARGGLELLGVELQRRGVGQQPLAEVLGLAVLADLRQRGDQPERADQERALLARAGRRRWPRCGSAARGRPRSAPRGSPSRSRARARPRAAGSARAARAGVEASSASVS